MSNNVRFGKRPALPILIALAAIAGVLITTTLAMAHASPERSEPASNSVLATAPTQVTMWFSEPLEPAFSQIQVLDSASKRVDAGNSKVDSADTKKMSVGLSQLPNGTFTVAWKTLSAIDGHGLRGSYVFSVGEPQSTTPSTLQIEAPLLQSPFDPPARWLVLLGGITVLGGLVFELLILSPALKKEFRQVPEMTTARSRIRKVQIAGAIVFLIASIAQVVIQAGTISGEPLYRLTSLPIQDVIFNTTWGHVWRWRIVLLIVSLILLVLPYFFRSRALREAAGWAALAGSAGMMLALSWVSHGAALTELRTPALFSDYTHLLAASVWIGSLFSFLILIWSIYKLASSVQRDRILSTMVPKFSVLATLCVGTLMITGIFSSWAQVNSIGALNTPYGFALIAKLLLIVPLLGLGALNLLWVRRNLNKQRDHAQEASGWLRRFVTGEVVLMCLILLSVGMILSLEPARQVKSREDSSKPGEISRALTVDSTKIDVKITPGVVGTNKVTITLKDAVGDPITNAVLVSLRFTFLNADVGSVTGTAKDTGNGVYVADGISMSIRGAWVGTVRVSRPDSLDMVASLQFSLAEAGQPSANSVPSTSTGKLLMLMEFLFIGGLFAAVGMVIGGFGTNAGSKILSSGLICAAVGISIFLFTRGINPNNGSQFTVPPIPTPSSGSNPIINGKALFNENCASCHGVEGLGDGPFAEKLNPKPFNLQVHAPLHTDPELYTFIAKGIAGTAMDNWESTLKSDDIWDIIFYLRALTQPTNTSDIN